MDCVGNCPESNCRGNGDKLRQCTNKARHGRRHSALLEGGWRVGQHREQQYLKSRKSQEEQQRVRLKKDAIYRDKRRPSCSLSLRQRSFLLLVRKPHIRHKHDRGQGHEDCIGNPEPSKTACSKDGWGNDTAAHCAEHSAEHKNARRGPNPRRNDAHLNHNWNRCDDTNEGQPLEPSGDNQERYTRGSSL